MEENTKATDQPTQAENTGNESEVQGTQGKEQKLFTQEEVNRFVQSRLSREKGQVTKEAQAEYEQKLADLQSREMRLLTKEKLDARGMSRELADIITCTDEKDLNNKLETLEKIYGNNAKQKEQPTGFIQVGVASGGFSGSQGTDPVRKAMGLN